MQRGPNVIARISHDTGRHLSPTEDPLVQGPIAGPFYYRERDEMFASGRSGAECFPSPPSL